MSAGITKEPPDFNDVDDDQEYGSPFRSKMKPLFPTTSRRVGRSLKQPPGPSVDDGQSDAGGGAEDASENPISETIVRIGEVLKTRHGYDRLENLFLEMMPEETERIQRTVSQLHEEQVFNLRILIATLAGKPQISYKTREKMDLLLGSDQRSIMCIDGGAITLIVAPDLSGDQMLDEAIEALVDEIHMVAAENGVRSDRHRLTVFMRDLIAQG